MKNIENNNVENMLNIACERGEVNKEEIEALVNYIEKKTLILSKENEFVENIDIYNGILRELLIAIEKKDVLLIKDIYKFKLEVLIEDFEK